MSALDVLVAVGCLGFLLYVVGADRIRDVLEDFWAESDRDAHIREVRLRNELEAWWALPTREPRRRA